MQESWASLNSYKGFEHKKELRIDTVEEGLRKLKDDPSLSVRVRPKEASLSLKLGWRKKLDGTSEIRVLQVGDGSIVTLFDKTPLPSEPKDVVCPHFTQVKWGYGCPYDCSWCYLKGTLRFLDTRTQPVIKETQKIISHVKFFVDNWQQHPVLLNTGEICDSLMSESTKEPLSLMLHPVLKKSKHKLLFLTKSNRVDRLVENGFHREVVMSFSLNAKEVAERWEKRAPSVASRIEAASRVSDRGYETRVRIDPIVPVQKWATSYTGLVDAILDKLTPSRITLGSLRGLQSTINNAKDTSWTRFLSDRSNWGLKVAFDKRYAVYSSVIEYLRDEYDYEEVGLCKETVEMWRALGMDYRRIICNCAT